MQTEPIQFDAVSSSAAKRSAAGFASSHRVPKSPRNLSTAILLDEAFAEYSRVDAGTPTNESIATFAPTAWRAATRELIADISTQVRSLDRQRRRLARLLNSIETDAPV